MGKAISYKQIEKDLGLKITKIKNKKALNKILELGLIQLYQQVFANPPYNEKFEAQQVREIFEDYLNSRGHIFVASEIDTNRPVAFVTSVPVKSEFDVAALAGERFKLRRTQYFAEDGVASSHQRQGISNRMKHLLLDACAASRVKTLLLRTKADNYKQISAVNKAGGSVVSGMFQQVTSKRKDGLMSTDTRAFYEFDVKQKNATKDTRVLDRVTIVRPGGNDTAIVWDRVPREQQGALSKEIQDVYPGVEQVMYVEDAGENKFRGQMAGGEFCGNATRSLGYLLLGQKDGKIELEVSGSETPMQVVVQDGFSSTTSPIRTSLNSVIEDDGLGFTVAHLDGISFIIATQDSSIGQSIKTLETVDAQKDFVKELLKKEGFADAYPASGVLIVKRKPNGDYYSDPYVYVRDTGTLYYETGCGSGSTAIGLMEAKKSGDAVSGLKIQQPSGMDLYVDIDRNADGFVGAKVNGPVEVVFDGKMYLTKRYGAKPKAAQLA